MLRTDFHFELPKELIAQHPTAERSGSRLLTLSRQSGLFEDREFRDFPALLGPRDLLIFNDTRVIPARAYGVKDSGGRVEMLLERALSADSALVHVRASKGLKEGATVKLAGGAERRHDRARRRTFRPEVLLRRDRILSSARAGAAAALYRSRRRRDADRERYQTVYARALGAVAAPTAGLHFDEAIFAALRARNIAHAFVTLHVGAGTFAPMRADDIDQHEMHSEYLEVPLHTCQAIERAREAGGRVIAVGTTVVRSLETAAGAAPGGSAIAPYRGNTRIFIKPGHVFRAVDAMVTNFHLPESTLLMLCSAFAGRESLLAAYAHAVRERYRFFSYGDAMFLT